MSLPYFPLYPTDFEADTSHLTLEEDGAYNRLLRLSWMTPGCSLPDDPTWIARRMRIDGATFDRVVAPLLEEFFYRAKGRIKNPKLTSIHEETNEKHTRRVEAGKKGGRPPKPLKSRETDETNAKALPKQPEPEPEPDIRDGGGGTREPISTDREAILTAIGVDPISGITGPSARQIGTRADMAEVDRWLALPGITMPLVIEEVRRVMANKRDGPPSSFKFFTKAIQRLSGELTQPSLSPITSGKGARHDRQRFDQTIDAVAAGLSSGAIGLGLESRDPFAKRPGRDAQEGEHGPGPLLRPGQ